MWAGVQNLPAGQGFCGPQPLIGVHWWAMQTAPVPQSPSLLQLMVGTQSPVRKSHVVPPGQSALLVQPVVVGVHIPFLHTCWGGQATLVHGSPFGRQMPEV